VVMVECLCKAAVRDEGAFVFLLGIALHSASSESRMHRKIERSSLC
jgi:hypothetical protein